VKDLRWVVIAVFTYPENASFGVPAPAAIVLGAMMVSQWYDTVGQFK
jgi:hypothetical protein